MLNLNVHLNSTFSGRESMRSYLYYLMLSLSFFSLCPLSALPANAAGTGTGTGTGNTPVDVSSWSQLLDHNNYVRGINITAPITVETDEQVYIPYHSLPVTINGNNYEITGGNKTAYWHFIQNKVNITDLNLAGFGHQPKAVLNFSESDAVLSGVNINGIMSVDGNVELWGGMINMEGGSTLTVENSVFQNADIRTSYSGYKDGVSGGVINVQGNMGGTAASTISLINNTQFLNNSVSSSGISAYGGSIANEGTIDTISNSVFDGNRLTATGELSDTTGAAYGGAIANGSANEDRGVPAINVIENTSFKNNAVYALSGEAYGGAVYNDGEIGNIKNSNFTNNHADGLGGAIYSTQNLALTADGQSVLFSGNTDGSGANDIYLAGGNFDITLANSGSMTFDGGINGTEGYTVTVNGDGSNVLNMNGAVKNADSITVSGAKIALGSESYLDQASYAMNNAELVLNNRSVGTMKLKNYASSSGTLHIDVDPVNNTSDKLEVSGDVSGTTKLIVHALSTNTPTKSIVFAEAEGAGSADSFTTAAVYGSPYDYEVQYAALDSGLKQWYFEGVEPENPDQPDVPAAMRAEVIAGMGLHEAAIEQTRSVVRNVRTKVAAGREYCPNCGIYSAEWDGKQLRNVWVLAQGESATIDKPVKMDADIWGVEAGFDVQNDVNNTLGVFASYRKGEYDLSGKADKVRSNIGSEIDIDSYLAGLYYRYDKNMNWLFATVYGGVQQADAKTDDKIAKFDTDGIEFGAAVEAGHTFALSSDLTLDPSLGLYYTQINFDDAKDNVGKEYDWKDVKHLEAELGVKLEKQIDAAKVYVKPSVIQTITSGDSVKITGLNKLSTYDDATLGRIGLGGRYGFTDALSAYGWVNYTFGSDYDATAFGAGLNYSW